MFSKLFFIISSFCLFLCCSSYPNTYYDYNYSELDYNFYDLTCPDLQRIVRTAVWQAIQKETRMAASLLRLHFHDCIVDGCDGSVLLDDTSTFKGEKNARPNQNSARGFEVIDKIKDDVERACPATVSCADILTLATREAVYLSGGPYWQVPLGRRDSRTASEKSANDQIPSPFEPLENITAKFTSKGLDFKDVVVLSGAHTVGFAQCFTFRRRLFNFKESGKPDPTLHPSMLGNLQSLCPDGDGTVNSKLAPLDSVTTSMFDNLYYKNLMNQTGLLESDQALMANPNGASLVKYYSMYPYQFSYDFAVSMAKMSQIGVLTGEKGEIRKKCGSVN